MFWECPSSWNNNNIAETLQTSENEAVKNQNIFRTRLEGFNLPSRKSWWEPQALEYRIHWEGSTPYAGAAGILQYINGKFTMEKSTPSLFSQSLVLNRPLLSISRCRPMYEAGLAVSVYSLLWQTSLKPM